MKYFYIRFIFASLLVYISTMAGRSFGGTNEQAGAQNKSDAQSRSCADEKNFSSCFTPVSWENGLTPDHFAYGLNTYAGPDGERVYFRVVHHHSVELTRERFESQIKAASKVVERIKAPGEKGNEMAILDVDNRDGCGGLIIIATAGEDFRTVQSKSSEDINIIARQMRIRFKSS